MFRTVRMRYTSALWLATCLCAPFAAHAVDRSAACAAATTISTNSTLHDYGSSVSELKIFKATLGGAGVVTVDVFSPGDETPEPKITFLGTACVTPNNPDSSFALIDETPGAVAVEIKSSSTFYFQLSPEDPAAELTGYKLRFTYLAALSSADETTTPSSDPSNICNSSSTALASGNITSSHYVEFDQGVDEWDGDIIGWNTTIPGLVHVVAVGADLASTLYEGTTCPSSGLLDEGELIGSGDRIAASFHAGNFRLEVEPANEVTGEYELHVKVYDMCDEGEGDDHGDSFLCASAVSVGGSASGELAATSDDDGDFYTFVLSSQKTIEVKTTGSTDTFGSLYNAAGLRLGTANSGTTSPNFRIAKVLTAGRYYVRVEGKDGAEGSYGLNVTELTEP